MEMLHVPFVGKPTGITIHKGVYPPTSRLIIDQLQATLQWIGHSSWQQKVLGIEIPQSRIFVISLRTNTMLVVEAPSAVL